jgi:hypothetical protein
MSLVDRVSCKVPQARFLTMMAMHGQVHSKKSLKHQAQVMMITVSLVGQRV